MFEMQDKTFLEFETQPPPRFSPLQRQLFLTSATIVLTLSSGMAAGYSSTLIPKLQEENSPIPIDHEEASWIASIVTLPYFAGSLTAAWLMEFFGKKRLLLGANALAALSWIGVGSAPNLVVLLTARFGSGLSIGLTVGAPQVFISEISHPKYRGFLLSTISLALMIGIFLVHVLGTFLDWRFTAYLGVVFPAVSNLIFALAPESPIWLLKKKREQEARDAFHWFRGYSQEALDEFGETLKRPCDDKNVREMFDYVRNSEFYKPFAIMVLYFATAQASGSTAIIYYAVMIVRSTIGPNMNEYTAMLIVDSIRVSSSVLGCYLIGKIRRRLLTMISGIGTAASLFCLAVMTYLKGLLLAPIFAYAAFVSYVSYNIFVIVGLYQLSSALLGELFPAAMRGIGSGTSGAIGCLLLFAVTKTCPGMMVNWGADVTFTIYGSTVLIGTIALYFVLPETKDKTLEEIENYFKK